MGTVGRKIERGFTGGNLAGEPAGYLAADSVEGDPLVGVPASSIRAVILPPSAVDPNPGDLGSIVCGKKFPRPIECDRVLPFQIDEPPHGIAHVGENPNSSICLSKKDGWKFNILPVFFPRVR
jgi:hypothetical protein